MNKIIYKYPLRATDEQVIKMPANASILAVQVQNHIPCIWALHDISAPAVDTHIRIYGTGCKIDDASGLFHIGTFQAEGGSLVFHVFIKRSAA